MGNVDLSSVHFQKTLLRMVRDPLALPPGLDSTSLTETRLTAGELTVSTHTHAHCTHTNTHPKHI